MVHISLSPNVQTCDVVTSIRALCCFWRLRNGAYIQRLIDALEIYFNRSVYLTNSGRSALYILLRGLGISSKDEVIVQAFSCNAVINPILWVGATPRYCDIVKDTYNMDVVCLRKCITKHTKAIIVQNTFGICADIEAIRNIAQEYNILVIEDCAHSLGAVYPNGVKVGSLCDVAFLSFGRDKVISSVYGGGIIVEGKHKKDIERVYRKECKPPSYWWIVQQLIHIPITFIALRLYTYGIGKGVLLVSQKLRLVSKAVSSQEKCGEMPSYFPSTLPNGLSRIALLQFERLSLFNAHRKRIAHMYEEALAQESGFLMPRTKSGDIVLRYPVQCDASRRIIESAQHTSVVLGDWYKNGIDPVGTNKETMHYTIGMCPVAENVAERVINLPTYIHIQQKDVDIIVRNVIEYRNEISTNSQQ